MTRNITLTDGTYQMLKEIKDRDGGSFDSAIMSIVAQRDYMSDEVQKLNVRITKVEEFIRSRSAV